MVTKTRRRLRRIYVTSIEDLPLHEGDWLILARTNDKLKKLKPDLKDMGIIL